jgi:hypothetical protein
MLFLRRPRISDVDRALDRIRKIHTPYSQEVEVWVDGPGEELHAERFPHCDAAECEGHDVPMLVCNECGHTHDGETPLYRAWPCPTIRALADLDTGR